MKRVDGLGVVLAALFAAVFVLWLGNTFLPHLWLAYLWTR
jgi:hypothetical protein